MLRSLFASITGLRAHQTMMDVTANNISNVNTQGFKAGRATFADALAQTVRGGGLPTEAAGGTNPMQIGLGTRVASINTLFTSGAPQATGRPTDLAIQGSGFFVVDQGGQRLLTRDGSFGWDGTGQLITATGARVIGWSADPTTGAIDPSTTPGFIAVPTGVLTPSPTSNVTVGGNLPAGAVVGDVVATSGTVFDSLGTAYDLTVRLTKAGPGSWTAQFTVTDPAGVTTDITPGPAPTLTFNGAGDLTSAASVALTGITLGGGNPQNLTIGFGSAQNAISQFDQVGTFDMPVADGQAGAELSEVSFGTDGSITARYTNGDSRVLAKIALATVTNPEGMMKVSDNLYQSTLTSGDPALGMAGTGELGTIAPGSLEGSNVDLASEFTTLVLAQRGFQANTRVITTSDEMLADLVNVKR
jgi:flagellar hook protein FlgE